MKRTQRWIPLDNDIIEATPSHLIIVHFANGEIRRYDEDNWPKELIISIFILPETPKY